MTRPLVSVVMPVFNGAKTLAAAAQTIVAQSLIEWELLAINDGSTDESGTVLDSLARVDRRIRPSHLPHQGIVAALNAGIAQANGRFIARMDADDLAFPQRLELQASCLGRKPEVGLVGSLVEFGGDRTRRAGYALHVEWLNSIVTPGQIALNRFIESPLAHPSILLRRELIAAHGGYRNGDFPEDYELILRWLEAGVQMAKVPQVLLRWNDPPDRLSRRDPRYSAESFYRLKAVYLARWLKRFVARDRPMLAWGAGRLTRRRVELLEAESVRVDGFVDIDPRKLGRRRDGREVISPEQIPSPRDCFVLGYVAKRGARELVRATLGQRGFVEGQDFLMAA